MEKIKGGDPNALFESFVGAEPATAPVRDAQQHETHCEAVVPEDFVKGHIAALIAETKREIEGLKGLKDETARQRSIMFMEKLVYAMQLFDPTVPMQSRPPGNKVSASMGCVTMPFSKKDRAWLKANAFMADTRGKDSLILYVPAGQAGKDFGDRAKKEGCSDDLWKSIHFHRGDLSGRFGHWVWFWSDERFTNELIET